jgi:hypothetical protein
LLLCLRYWLMNASRSPSMTAVISLVSQPATATQGVKRGRVLFNSWGPANRRARAQERVKCSSGTAAAWHHPQ